MENCGGKTVSIYSILKMGDTDSIAVTGDVLVDHLIQQKKNTRPSKEVRLVLERDGNNAQKEKAST
jgi:hypothetical protein